MSKKMTTNSQGDRYFIIATILIIVMVCLSIWLGYQNSNNVGAWENAKDSVGLILIVSSAVCIILSIITFFKKPSKVESASAIVYMLLSVYIGASSLFMLALNAL